VPCVPLLILLQVGKSLHLLGRHKAAADVYREAQNLGMDDWEVWHSSGLCHLQLKDLQK
jgi:Bardet-Biedl syndrome 4 protein